MPRSQIKQVQEDLFQLRRSKDFRHQPCALQFQEILLKQSQIKRASDGSFFENTMHSLFSSEKYWPAIGRTSGSEWTAPVPPSGIHPVTEQSPYDLCYPLFSTIHKKQLFQLKIKLQRILNNAYRSERQKD